MKLLFYFPLLTFLFGPSFGQTEQENLALENTLVLDEVVHQHGKNTLVIQRIEQPEFSPKSVSSQQEALSPSTQGGEEILPTQTFIVSATAYRGNATHLKIWNSDLGEKGALEGWSNINWSVFQRLLAVKGEDKNYQFMLFLIGGHQQNAVTAPEGLPKYDEAGARYMVTSGSGEETALNFLESIHALYENDREKLYEDHEIAIEQHQERQRQLQIEAENPQTRILKIWRHTRSDGNEINE